jgi:glyoxylate carboligase
MNNAELIVRTLKRAGVTCGFGIPSGNVLPLMEAMRTGGLDFVLTAHEGSEPCDRRRQRVSRPVSDACNYLQSEY